MKRGVTLAAVLLAAALLAAGCAPALSSPAGARRAAPPQPWAARVAPHPLDVSTMVLVPAGPFVRGANGSRTQVDERPQGRGSTGAFLIDRTEVDAAALQECVAHGACDPASLSEERLAAVARPSPHCTFAAKEREHHPANCLSWFQARDLCAHLGKRLPTEAEWEKAARGADDARRYPWGDAEPGPGGPPVANLADLSMREEWPSAEIFEGYRDGFATTAPVGSFPAGASPFGVLDMIGNVGEWTADAYDAVAYLREPGERSEPDESLRVARGGAWDSIPRTVRITRRWVLAPEVRLPSIGVRCAADPPGAAPAIGPR
jgi:formylglycine-generating enzyme required for sulfatase activity